MNIDKVIIALDVDTTGEAFNLVDKLPDVHYFKVGWQLFANEGNNILKGLADRDVDVFLDLKIDDIPNTVEKAVRTLTQYSCVKFFSFQGDEATLDACRSGSCSADIEFLFVPTLSTRPETTTSQFNNLMKNVHPSRPHLLDGVVASGDRIRWAKRSWPDWTVVAPGIRSVNNRNPHAMVSTPQEAFLMGADYIVIGREITIGFADPQEALNKIL